MLLTTDQKGAIAEAAVVLAATKLGIGVARPLGDERYDLVFDLRDRLLRVQCKWASRRDDVVVVRCYSARRTATGFHKSYYSPGEIDALAAYCPELERCYFLPLTAFPGRTQVHLRLQPSRNNQSARVNLAAEFEFAAKLSAPTGP